MAQVEPPFQPLPTSIHGLLVAFVFITHFNHKRLDLLARRWGLCLELQVKVGELKYCTIIAFWNMKSTMIILATEASNICSSSSNLRVIVFS
jgi:hypothetical protein